MRISQIIKLAIYLLVFPQAIFAQTTITTCTIVETCNVSQPCEAIQIDILFLDMDGVAPKVRSGNQYFETYPILNEDAFSWKLDEAHFIFYRLGRDEFVLTSVAPIVSETQRALDEAMQRLVLDLNMVDPEAVDDTPTFNEGNLGLNVSISRGKCEVQ